MPHSIFESCNKKQEYVKALFAACKNEEQKYEKIIELGRSASPLPPQEKIPQNLVNGCQSQMYLTSQLKDGLIYFRGESDALISAGLSEILIKVFSGETPETILKCPPKYLDDLGIGASLTPSRANGLYSIHLRMKQDALRFLMQRL